MSNLEKIARMLQESGFDAALITGDENAHYATGFGPLEGMVFITKEGKGYCCTDSRYIEAATAVAAPQGYAVEAPQGTYMQRAAELVARHGVKRLAFEDLLMSVSEHKKYKAALKEAEGCRLLPVGDRYEQLREIKEQYEIDLIVQAQRIAERAFDDMLDLIKPGVAECELAAELDYRMAKYGSQGVSFSTILVSGAKGSMPHGVPGKKLVQSGEFVTMDFGAMIGGYHSDMTRTVAVGKITSEMDKVYHTVLEAQKAGIEALDVGKTGHEVHMAAFDVIDRAGFGAYFGHGLGHSLGLNIHENPRAARNRKEVFHTGNVITMEPGIYLPGKMGVRIEDMLYLSENGKVNLTLAPKQLIVL